MLFFLTLVISNLVNMSNVTPTKCNILTWNVRGAMSSAGSISNLLDTYDIDIACISEHKLKSPSATFLDTLHSSYRSICVCEQVDLNAKCGKEGVSIMFKKSLSFAVQELRNIKSTRLTGIKLTSVESTIVTPIYVLCMYLPSANYTFDDYIECLTELQSIYDMYSNDGFIILCGDANVQLTDINDRRSTAFNNFLSDNELSSCINRGVNFTFKPSKRILDYVVLGKSQLDIV